MLIEYECSTISFTKGIAPFPKSFARTLDFTKQPPTKIVCGNHYDKCIFLYPFPEKWVSTFICPNFKCERCLNLPSVLHIHFLC
ncbi:hypothetical protein CW304_10685 [Bacillus sp. UFRGS-B20]|nr:hypothetical protein CW304_10685 [Bacillus sp. UFRGS-B20]